MNRADFSLVSPISPFGELADPQFWRNMAPDLHIEDHDFVRTQQNLRFGASKLDEMMQDLMKEGYTRLKPPDWQLGIPSLADAVTRIENDGLALVFAFVYDEFWLLFATLGPFLQRMIGRDYRALPNFWVWHVSPQDDAAGWQPHHDKGSCSLLPDGSPKSLTVWIALTEATPENGCLYIVPADRDPTYNTPREKEFQFALADIRALPAAAGTVYCWNQAVKHWGARSSSRGTHPRISVALEFQRGDVEPFNTPLLDPHVLLPFKDRLTLIAKQILQYKHMYPLPPDVEAFATKIIRKEH